MKIDDQCREVEQQCFISVLVPLNSYKGPFEGRSRPPRNWPVVPDVSPEKDEELPPAWAGCFSLSQRVASVAGGKSDEKVCTGWLWQLTLCRQSRVALVRMGRLPKESEVDVTPLCQPETCKSNGKMSVDLRSRTKILVQPWAWRSMSANEWRRQWWHKFGAPRSTGDNGDDSSRAKSLRQWRQQPMPVEVCRNGRWELCSVWLAS